MPEDLRDQHDNPRQIELMEQVVELATQQTRMSAQRTEQSEARCYHNAERTLSVWVRTALAMMVFGIAIDRFGLVLHHLPGTPPIGGGGHGVVLDSLSTGCGMALVAMGIVMTLSTGARFLAYALAWRRRHELPAHHGPYLAPFFALMVAVFGVALLAIMLAFTA